MYRRPFLVSLLSTPAAFALSGHAASEVYSYDVAIYGGTAAGAIAAIAAAGQGMKTALLEPRSHIGGMVSGGLGWTDYANKTVIGGLSRQFYLRVGERYEKPIEWHIEPHIAEEVFRHWLDEAGVHVFFQHRLESLAKEKNRIVSLRAKNGSVFSAKIFMDASYEGDLLPQAGISYTWGREGQDDYGESLAGRRYYSPKHQFPFDLSPYDEKGDLLPLVYSGNPGQTGERDRKVQAYNFRLCLTDVKSNQVPFPKPPDYDPKRYELLRRYLIESENQKKLPALGSLLKIDRIPNGKTDINNNGPISTDYIGGSWDYPEADESRRQQIWDDHVCYIQGFLYFLANDPSVPAPLHEAINQWGLAADEFTDTDHWPHQMYIREARRMIGEKVMVQADLQTHRTKDDSIGMGSYNSDSHHVQRIPTPEGFVINEGDMQVPVKPYEISYHSITPKQEECGNLLVPVPFSASHVAYSSMRMEPQYMIIGHAAGVAAAQAIRERVPVQKIDIKKLQATLHKQKAVLNMSDANENALNPMT